MENILWLLLGILVGAVAYLIYRERKYGNAMFDETYRFETVDGLSEKQWKDYCQRFGVNPDKADDQVIKVGSTEQQTEPQPVEDTFQDVKIEPGSVWMQISDDGDGVYFFFAVVIAYHKNLNVVVYKSTNRKYNGYFLRMPEFLGPYSDTKHEFLKYHVPVI